MDSDLCKNDLMLSQNQWVDRPSTIYLVGRVILTSLEGIALARVVNGYFVKSSSSDSYVCVFPIGCVEGEWPSNSNGRQCRHCRLSFIELEMRRDDLKRMKIIVWTHPSQCMFDP